MRIVRRVAEHAVDPLLQLLRQDVLQSLRLVVDVVHVQRYGSWTASSSAASFFTIALTEAGDTASRFARAVTDTRPLSVPSL